MLFFFTLHLRCRWHQTLFISWVNLGKEGGRILCPSYWVCLGVFSNNCIWLAFFFHREKRLSYEENELNLRVSEIDVYLNLNLFYCFFVLLGCDLEGIPCITDIDLILHITDNKIFFESGIVLYYDLKLEHEESENKQHVKGEWTQVLLTYHFIMDNGQWTMNNGHFRFLLRYSILSTVYILVSWWCSTLFVLYI